MCRTCVDEARKRFDLRTDRELSDLLMGATAFPMADARTIVRQLRELSKEVGRDHRKAMAFVDMEMEADMRKFRQQHPE